MYIGQWTQAWQPVHCLGLEILHQVVLHQVILHQVILHQVVFHQVVFHQVFIRFDDTEILAIDFGAVLDYLPDRPYFRLLCSLIKALNSWQSAIALGMYRSYHSLHCRLVISDSVSFWNLCVLSGK